MGSGTILGSDAMGYMTPAAISAAVGVHTPASFAIYSNVLSKIGAAIGATTGTSGVA